MTQALDSVENVKKQICSSPVEQQRDGYEYGPAPTFAFKTDGTCTFDEHHAGKTKGEGMDFHREGTYSIKQDKELNYVVDVDWKSGSQTRHYHCEIGEHRGKLMKKTEKLPGETKVFHYQVIPTSEAQVQLKAFF